MPLLHVYDGRTDNGEYYWFVLAEDDDCEQLFLTMPKERVSAGIQEKFRAIKDAYLAEREGNASNSAKQVADAIKGVCGFEFWSTKDSDKRP